MTAREAFERFRFDRDIAVLHGQDLNDGEAVYLSETRNGELVVNDCMLIADDEDIERVLGFLEPSRRSYRSYPD